MLKQGISVFAPILYDQIPIEEFPERGLETRRRLLMPMKINFLINPQGIILLKLNGWEKSCGASVNI